MVDRDRGRRLRPPARYRPRGRAALALPDAVPVADPFHLVRLAGEKLDVVRRRVQNETLGHRGRKHNPLCSSRRLLVLAHDRLERAGSKLHPSSAGDPRGDVTCARLAMEAVKSLYAHCNQQFVLEWFKKPSEDLRGRACPSRGSPAWTHRAPLADPDRRVAPGPGDQRVERDRERLAKRIKEVRSRRPTSATSGSGWCSPSDGRTGRASAPRRSRDPAEIRNANSPLSENRWPETRGVPGQE